eukprot:PRCOL_00000038-RA
MSACEQAWLGRKVAAATGRRKSERVAGGGLEGGEGKLHAPDAVIAADAATSGTARSGRASGGWRQNPARARVGASDGDELEDVGVERMRDGLDGRRLLDALRQPRLRDRNGTGQRPGKGVFPLRHGALHR